MVRFIFFFIVIILFINTTIRGTFRMEREDGYTFDCRIPPFSLESKPDNGGPATPPPDNDSV